MEKRLVTQYSMKSAIDAEENETRVKAVFAELATDHPAT